MNDSGYAVYFFPQALEALGEAIKPYLQEGPSGTVVRCKAIDTGGSLIEMTLEGRDPEGQRVETELMVPTAMVRMIVSAHGDEMFGFGPSVFEKTAAALPPVGPTAEPATAKSEALPRSRASEASAAGPVATLSPVVSVATAAPADSLRNAGADKGKPAS